MEGPGRYSDHALLASRPEPDRYSRRRVLVTVAVGVAALAPWIWQRTRPYQPTPADRASEQFVRDYLGRTQAYSNLITDTEVRAQRLYVTTSIGDGQQHRPVEKQDEHQPGWRYPAGSAEFNLALEIYEKLWIEICMAHPEAGVYYVYILDHNGRLMTGGQA